MKIRTKRQVHVAGVVAVVAGAALWQHARAQDTERLTVEVGECVDLPTPEERLACFEARVEDARQERTGESVDEPSNRASAPASAGREAERDTPAAEESVGLREGRERRRADEKDGGRSRREPQTEVVGRVAELRETVPNSYLITLDDGQVWRQTLPMPYPLRPGSEVRIYTTRWAGAYRLSAPDLRGSIQVERVR